MRTPIFQIDAFTTRRFAGNPAAVMPMDRFLDDAVLQAIAAENNLAETAFLVPEGGDYRLRWFTPTTEVPLCGHATLASAAVVMERLEPGRDKVVFHSASGPLTVNRTDDGLRHGLPGAAVRAGLDTTRPRRSTGRRSCRGVARYLQLHGFAGERATSCARWLPISRRSPAWTAAG